MTPQAEASIPRRGGWRNRRHLAALAIAVAADAVQIGLLPLFIEGAAAPWNDALDLTVAAALVALLGWHAALLPAFLGELVPILDLFPTWTATVIFVITRRRPWKPGNASTSSVPSTTCGLSRGGLDLPGLLDVVAAEPYVVPV